jgi:uncharacterized integral membrane protein
MTDTNTCDQIEVLLSGYLDGELTQQEAQRVRVHLDTCAHCRQLHKDLTGLKAQMKHLSYPKSDEEILQAIETDLVASTGMGVGWVLLILGLLVAAGVGAYGLYLFFAAPDVPLGVRIFYGLFIIGALALFIAVLRQRLITYKHDKYKKVKL